MPRRNLDRYSRIKPSISFFSYKNRNAQFCESTNEQNTLLTLEFDDRVISYRTQPTTFGYRVGRSRRRYTPDVLVLYRSGIFEYEEIKPELEAATEAFRERFAHLVYLFRTRVGVRLALRTGHGPSVGARFENLRRLYGYLQDAPDEGWLRALRPLGGSFRYAEAVWWLSRKGGSAAVLLTLLAHQRLVFDLSHPLTDDTRLEVWHG